MHLGNPVHRMLVHFSRLSRADTPRLDHVAYAISCGRWKLALQLEEAALSSFFRCCPCFYVSASVYAATSQTRSGNLSKLKLSGAGEVSAGSDPPDAPISIREGTAQELK